MKNLITTFALFFIIIGAAHSQKPGKPMVNPAAVSKDGMAMAYYQRDHLRLAEDFAAYDTHLHSISKKQFLQQLTTGNYLPLRLNSPNGAWTYQLYKLTGSEGKDVKEVIQQFAGNYLQHYEMEGKKFPPFHYVDLTVRFIPAKTPKEKSWC